MAPLVPGTMLRRAIILLTQMSCTVSFRVTVGAGAPFLLARRSACTAASKQDEEPRVPLAELLSTCVDAAQRGCDEIRRVHASLSTEGGAISDSAVDYKVAGDSRSALTAADLAAQCAVVEGLERAWPGLRIVGEEDLACSVDSDAAMGGVCASDLAWSIAAAEPAGLRRDLLSALLEESAPEAAPVDTCQTAARSLLEECELQGGKGGASSRSEPLSDVRLPQDCCVFTHCFMNLRCASLLTKAVRLA